MFINCYIYDYRTNIKTSRRNKIEYKCSNINKVNMTNPMVQKQNIEIKWLESFIKTQNSVEDMHLSNWKKIGLKLIKNYTFPSKNDEVWRFTDLKKLYNLNFNKHPSESDILEFCDKINIENKIIFENGKLVYFDKTLSENKMIEIKKFTELNNDEKKKVLELSNSGECGISGGFFSILNITSINDIYILKFNEDFTIETNINLISIGASNENQEIGFSKRLLVLLENKSEVKFNLINTSTKKEDIYFENSCINFYLKENSNLVLQNINNSVGSSNIMNTIHVDLNKGSFFTFNSISFGGDFERINIGVDMNGPESQCKLNGVFINHQNKIADIHSRISHNFPNCKSSQFQKNILNNFSHAIFAGKIQIQFGAENSEAEQLCRTLMLSPKSRIDSIPILEINNENVKCSHGATVSDIDDEQMFYLISRGIEKKIAQLILIKGFINESLIPLPLYLKNSIEKKIFSLLE